MLALRWAAASSTSTDSQVAYECSSAGEAYPKMRHADRMMPYCRSHRGVADWKRSGHLVRCQYIIPRRIFKVLLDRTMGGRRLDRCRYIRRVFKVLSVSLARSKDQSARVPSACRDGEHERAVVSCIAWRHEGGPVFLFPPLPALPAWLIRVLWEPHAKRLVRALDIAVLGPSDSQLGGVVHAPCVHSPLGCEGREVMVA